MASGVKMSECAIQAFEDMKTKAKPRIRLATFTIKESEIVVCNKYTVDDLGVGDVPEDPYQLLYNLVADDCCFYFLYDCHFETKEGHHKEELVFGSWIPDTCKIKHKMLYSSSRCNVRNCFKGVKHCLQVSARDGIFPLDQFVGEIERNAPPIDKIEGRSVRGCSQQQEQHGHHKHQEQQHM